MQSPHRKLPGALYKCQPLRSGAAVGTFLKDPGAIREPPLRKIPTDYSVGIRYWEISPYWQSVVLSPKEGNTVTLYFLGYLSLMKFALI